MDNPPTAFSVTVTNIGGQFGLVLRGELDIATAPDLTAALVNLIEQGPTELVLDLSGLAFIDSSGIAALITAQEALKKQGRHLTVHSPTPIVSKVLEVTQLEDYLNSDSNKGTIEDRRMGQI